MLGHADDDMPEDLYSSHRRDANRLSRQWQRGMHRAAAAFAAGDPGAAHRLAAEARRVRCAPSCQGGAQVLASICIGVPSITVRVSFESQS